RMQPRARRAGYRAVWVARQPRRAWSATSDDVRSEVRAWLREHWSPGADEDAFVRAAIDDGWAAPSLSLELWGRGLDEDLVGIVADEFVAAGAPRGAAGVPATSLALHLIDEYGASDELKAVARGFLVGEQRLCLLYSE